MKSKTKDKEYDKLVVRLTNILFKFNSGERVTIDSLALEFGVSTRTVQRDINDRFSFLPIEKDGKEYFLKDVAIGKLSIDDIKSFATFSGVNSLYPNLTNQFLSDILNDKIKKAYMVKNSGFENINDKERDFSNLTAAILEQKLVKFFYNDKLRVVKPYKLSNVNGVWYLNATENGELKTYTFSKIRSLSIINENFIQDETVLTSIEKSNINFFSTDTKEVHLQVENVAKEYFLRKNNLPNMKIIEQNRDCFVVSTTISFDDEILNFVRYWIPYIKILEPIYLKEKLEKILKDYLNEIK